MQDMGGVPVSTHTLSSRGWLSHDEVQVGDKTIGFNPKTSCSEWTLVTAVTRHDVTADGDQPGWWITPGSETALLVAVRSSAMPILALAHSARSATGSSTAWITAAVAAATFVLTAGLTLLVQLYIVPRGETRKRQDARGERNVLGLGERPTTAALLIR